MLSVANDWNPKQAELNKIIKIKDRFNEAIDLVLEMHKLVHFSKMSTVHCETIADEIFKGIDENDLCIMPTIKDVTIAWNIWHITRIEDIVINLLINNNNQVLDDELLKRLNISIKDTGNAMTDKEIISLSKELDKTELVNYRNKVGARTQDILRSLSPKDMKRKVSDASLKRVLKEGGVFEHPESIWLLEFWGKKDVAGLICMPITRHQIVHLNDCQKLKTKIKGKNQLG